MDKSVSLVFVDRVARRVRNIISVSSQQISRTAVKKEISQEAAKQLIVSRVAEKALTLAGGNQQMAVTAITIVNGELLRMPHCIALLKKYKTVVVKMAYDAKSRLAVSDTSLVRLCRLIEHTDQDVEGEAGQLIDFLEEIGMASMSRRHGWYLMRKIVDAIEDGHLIESIVDQLRSEIDRDQIEYEKSTVAEKNAYYGIRDHHESD